MNELPPAQAAEDPGGRDADPAVPRPPGPTGRAVPGERQRCPRCRGEGTRAVHTSAGPSPACHLCHQSGTVGSVEWLVSPYGFKVHAFFAPSGVSAEAACMHTTLTARLVEDNGTAEVCQTCQMIVGMMILEAPPPPGVS